MGWESHLSFCLENETIDHLFFQCLVAKITWGLVSLCFGASDISKNIQQYKTWIVKLFPGGGPVYTSRCAAVCWAIWKCRNRTCLDKKLIKNPTDILIHVCSFLTHWAVLYNPETQGKILEGVQALLACTHRVMEGQPASPTTVRPPSLR